jgi:hypothetical protein
MRTRSWLFLVGIDKPDDSQKVDLVEQRIICSVEFQWYEEQPKQAQQRKYMSTTLGNLSSAGNLPAFTPVVGKQWSQSSHTGPRSTEFEDNFFRNFGSYGTLQHPYLVLHLSLHRTA